MADLLSLNYTPAASRFTSRMQGYAEAVRQGGDRATRDQMASVRTLIVQSTPVDTGRLQRSWSPVVPRGALSWGIWTWLPYAPVLEYGGYRGVGPKTVALGGGSLGEGFVAGAGIYSRQAPLGWVRRALADAAPDYARRLQNVVRTAWGKGGTGPSLTGSTWARGAGTQVMNLAPSQLESLFGVSIVTSTRAL